MIAHKLGRSFNPMGFIFCIIRDMSKNGLLRSFTSRNTLFILVSDNSTPFLVNYLSLADLLLVK